MQFTSDQIKARIIRKLVQWRKWGGSHTENVIAGMPRHLRGDRATKQALKELLDAGWLIGQKKTGETHYSLNPSKISEILGFYEKYCKQ